MKSRVKGVDFDSLHVHLLHQAGQGVFCKNVSVILGTGLLVKQRKQQVLDQQIVIRCRKVFLLQFVTKSVVANCVLDLNLDRVNLVHNHNVDIIMSGHFQRRNGS